MPYVIPLSDDLVVVLSGGVHVAQHFVAQGLELLFGQFGVVGDSVQYGLAGVTDIAPDTPLGNLQTLADEHAVVEQVDEHFLVIHNRILLKVIR